MSAGEFNGRLMQDMLDERIEVLESRLEKLRNMRRIVNGLTFYLCPVGHGAFGIWEGQEIKCKMCKRLGK